LDANGLALLLFTGGFGLVAGYLIGRTYNGTELETYRQIIRDTQQHNIDAMQKKRSPSNDEAN